MAFQKTAKLLGISVSRAGCGKIVLTTNRREETLRADGNISEVDCMFVKIHRDYTTKNHEFYFMVILPQQAKINEKQVAIFPLKEHFQAIFTISISFLVNIQSCYYF